MTAALPVPCVVHAVVAVLLPESLSKEERMRRYDEAQALAAKKATETGSRGWQPPPALQRPRVQTLFFLRCAPARLPAVCARAPTCCVCVPPVQRCSPTAVRARRRGAARLDAARR